MIDSLSLSCGNMIRVISLVLLLAVSSNVSMAALVNGSFEEPDVGWSFVNLNRVSSASGYLPSDGSWMVVLPPYLQGGYYQGTMKQTFTVDSTAFYLLQVDLQSIDGGAGMSVGVTGASGATITFSSLFWPGVGAWPTTSVALGELEVGKTYELSLNARSFNITGDCNPPPCPTCPPGPCSPPQYGGSVWIDNVRLVAGANLAPVASDVAVQGVTASLMNWTPVAVDSDYGPKQLSCRLGTPPTNGTATVVSNCASGTYQSNPGFIGIDSFTYIANDGITDSNPATVTVAVIDEGVFPPCLKQYPVSQFSQTGKQGSLSITFTGNIVSYTNKAVKVCPGTTLKYQTSSTQGPVVCKVKNNTTPGSGSLKINDNLKCTDKPSGKDKIYFKLKSGVK